ncbi:MAG: PHP domain-containing protein [Candidatus Eremiobacteraeota bacterium]|nr:PHP domain-containing protein [Candidatus Eremiobacteraeota bacterium]
MDLHIHSCLSPCGELEMTPGMIVMEAKKKGLHAVAICDHNSAENVVAAQRAGERNGIRVLGGIEVTSREEVHVLSLFEDNESLFELQRIIYENLEGENDTEAFGYQIVTDEEDEPSELNEHLLIGATKLSINAIVKEIHRLSGLAVASHVDREGFGIITQLGFIPPSLKLDALEISPRITYEKARKTLAVGAFPLITSSDAHRLEEIGKSFTRVLVEDVTVEELRKAFLGVEGRKILEGEEGMAHASRGACRS